jgi:hypothetical protein
MTLSGVAPAGDRPPGRRIGALAAPTVDELRTLLVQDVVGAGRPQ